MERILRRLDADLDSASYLILDFRRVLQIDDCARALLSQLQISLSARRKKLILVHLSHTDAQFLRRPQLSEWQEALFFADTDLALEWCETQMIGEEQPHLVRTDAPLPLACMEMVAGFDGREIALLESILQKKSYCAGETILREGEVADSLHLLAAGSASVCLRLSNGTQSKRVSSIGPGLAFGELALLDGGVRSADVVADEPVVCYVLATEKLNSLATNYPEIRHKLILNIARELSGRLRRADAEIRSLAD
jgi:glutaminase